MIARAACSLQLEITHSSQKYFDKSAALFICKLAASSSQLFITFSANRIVQIQHTVHSYHENPHGLPRKHLPQPAGRGHPEA